jgi:hypothetical protein
MGRSIGQGWGRFMPLGRGFELAGGFWVVAEFFLVMLTPCLMGITRDP